MQKQTLFGLVKSLRNRHFMAIDIFIFFVAPFLSMLVRFDGDVNWGLYQIPVLLSVILLASVKLAFFFYYKFYGRLWRLASVDELAYALFVAMMVIIGELVVFVVLKKAALYPFSVLPFSLPLLDSVLSMLFVISLRFSIRFIEGAAQRKSVRKQKRQKVLIAGAGEAGCSVVREMHRNNYLGLNPVAFVDDDKSKHNFKLLGIPIKGSCTDIPKVVKELKIQKIIIAMPLASGNKIREIMSAGEAAGVETLTIPGISEILNGRVNISKLRKVQIEDLLRRDPVRTNIAKVRQLIYGKRVLITGAGGSIGGELCRQVLKCNPSELVIIGHGENSIFEIEQELKGRRKERIDGEKLYTKISARIADLRFKERLRDIYTEFNPEIVFHAAAHKHVPLMEANPQEAVTNNILGTKNLVDVSVEFGVNHFISISTDKAVNPTSIMGASKRVTEMIVLDAAARTGKFYSAVRFGNVLGSRGSVVKTFQKQLQEGGPITITHQDIIRYFMTIPEAVQLVLQASVLGKGGEVFLLDMGEPVKILDLAKDLIRLAGLREGIDIDIKITGLRPGEKLFEELFVKGEQYNKTIHEKILIAHNASTCIAENLDEILKYFQDSGSQLTRDEIVSKLCDIIPEFRPEEGRIGFTYNSHEPHRKKLALIKFKEAN